MKPIYSLSLNEIEVERDILTNKVYAGNLRLFYEDDTETAFLELLLSFEDVFRLYDYEQYGRDNNENLYIYTACSGYHHFKRGTRILFYDKNAEITINTNNDCDYISIDSKEYKEINIPFNSESIIGLKGLYDSLCNKKMVLNDDMVDTIIKYQRA